MSGRRASLRIEQCLVLGIVGVTLVVSAALIGAQRQQSLELLAQRITAMEQVARDVYIVNQPLDPATPTVRSGWHPPATFMRPAALVLLVGVGAGIAWYLGHLLRRKVEEPSSDLGKARSPRWAAQVASRRQAVRDALGTDILELLKSRLTVRQLMTDCAPVATAATPISALREMICSSPFRHVLICDETQRLIGIVSHRDLIDRVGKNATELMTCEPIFIPPGTQLSHAVTLMVENHLSCLPVVEKGRLLGSLTNDDLTIALECLLDSIRNLSDVAELPLEPSRQTSICATETWRMSKDDQATEPVALVPPRV